MKVKKNNIYLPTNKRERKNLFDLRGKRLSAIGESIRHGKEKIHHLFKMQKVENG